MSDVTLRALIEQQGVIQVRGFPQALDGASGRVLSGQVQGGTASAAWKLVQSKGEDEVRRLLDVDVIHLLLDGWTRYRTLAEFADPDRHPRSETNQVALANHSMTLTYEPSITITVNGAKLPPLVFTMTVALDLKAIVLTIKGGRIVALASGSCEGRVKVELDGAEIVSELLRSVDLPGVLDLGAGVEIPRLGGASERADTSAVATDASAK